VSTGQWVPVPEPAVAEYDASTIVVGAGHGVSGAVGEGVVTVGCAVHMSVYWPLARVSCELYIWGPFEGAG